MYIFSMLKRVSICLVFAFLLSGCSDIFEVDISDKNVVLSTPPDSSVTATSQQSFRWDPLDDALFYQIQIATPDFINPVYYELDSTISKAYFLYSLPMGSTYQWRVKALNGSSETRYVTRTIFTDTNQVLTNTKITLVTPSNALVTNQTFINFSWLAMPNADDYFFELRENNGTNTTVLGYEFRVDTSGITVEMPEGNFLWYVQGHNENSVTLYSFRSILIDTTVPLSPLLIEPSDSDTLIAFPIRFTWDSDNDEGSEITNYLEIYSDTVSFDLVNSFQLAEETLLVDTLSGGDYFWRVYSEDEVGNMGAYSAINTFRVE
jgi:hypothetical protein